MSKPFLHRAPDELVSRVEAWALTHGKVNRTVAINLLIANALEADERAEMRAEIQGLRELVVKLATVHGERAAEIPGRYFEGAMKLNASLQGRPVWPFGPECSQCGNLKNPREACIGCGVYENAREAVEKSVAPLSNADLPLIAKTALNDYRKDI